VFLLFANLRAVSVVHEIYRNPEVDPRGLFKQYLTFYGWLVCWSPATFMHFMAVFRAPLARRPGAGAQRGHVVVAGYLVPSISAVWQRG
jgi:hypothetical protein